jgi:hypothetical protein
MSVTLPDSLVHLGDGVFESCTELTEIDIPNGIVTISDGSFYDCTSLARVRFPAGLQVIEAIAFEHCSALPEVTFPETLQSIGFWSFGRCRSLKFVWLPDSLVELGQGAFTESGVTSFSIRGTIPVLDLPFTTFDSEYTSSLAEVHIRGPLGSAICSVVDDIDPLSLDWFVTVSSQVSAQFICTNVPYTVEPDETIRPSPPQTNNIPRTQPASRSPTPAPTPLNTLPPNAPEQEFKIEDTKYFNVDDIKTADKIPVLDGSGVISGEDNDKSPVELRFTSVVVAPGAKITADNVTVESFLELRDSAVLEPNPLDKIQLKSDVTLKFSGNTPETLPRFDLGIIGSDYAVVPSTIEIVIADSPGEVPDQQHQLIVKGRTLGNCDEWKVKLTGLPNSLEGRCEIVTSPGAKLAAIDDEIGLFLVKKQGNDNNDDELDVGLIVGIVIAAVVVIVAVAVGVVIFLKKRKGKVEAASTPEVDKPS